MDARDLDHRKDLTRLDCSASVDDVKQTPNLAAHTKETN